MRQFQAISGSVWCYQGGKRAFYNGNSVETKDIFSIDSIKKYSTVKELSSDKFLFQKEFESVGFVFPSKTFDNGFVTKVSGETANLLYKLVKQTSLELRVNSLLPLHSSTYYFSYVKHNNNYGFYPRDLGSSNPIATLEEAVATLLKLGSNKLELDNFLFEVDIELTRVTLESPNNKICLTFDKFEQVYKFFQTLTKE